MATDLINRICCPFCKSKEIKCHGFLYLDFDDIDSLTIYTCSNCKCEFLIKKEGA